MTAKQLKGLYFPAWAAAWRALRSDPVFTSPDLRQLHARLVQIAVARGSCRASLPQADQADIHRHACHLLALGQDKSAKTLTNPELDRVLALFRLLANPDDLTAHLTWNQGSGTGASPDASSSTRQRILWWLRNKCVESYIVELSRERFGTKNWEALPFDQLQQLHMTLKNRAKSQCSRNLQVASAATIAGDTEIEPV